MAKEGYCALAVAYFNAEGLPKHLAQIPLEYIDETIDALAKRPEVDSKRIGIIGYSKGAELALLVASRREDIDAVVAFAPGSSVFQGFKPPKYPTISSWSLNGEELPFVPNNYDKKFFKTYDGMYLWYRTLAQHDAVEAAAIPVEKIKGDILLITGVNDGIWPSTIMAEQIVTRLYLAEFSNSYKHLAFPEAGHGIAVPPGEPTTSVARRLGGTPQGNAVARQHGWRAVKEFLEVSLGDEKSR